MHHLPDVIRRLAVAAVLIVPLVLASGCGQERSTAAYCKAYNSGFDRIKRDYPDVDQYSSTKENPLLLLARTTSALGDVVALIGGMAKAAPSDIESDTQRVHDSLEKQLDLVGGTAGAAASRNLSGALSGLASGFMSSLLNAGAFQRVDDYVVSNCGGKHMFSASPQT
jgi:hypothetical protein